MQSEDGNKSIKPADARQERTEKKTPEYRDKLSLLKKGPEFRKAVGVLLGIGEGGIAPESAEAVPECFLYDPQRAADPAYRREMQRLAAENGSVPVPDGAYRFFLSMPAVTILFRDSLPVMAEHFLTNRAMWEPAGDAVLAAAEHTVGHRQFPLLESFFLRKKDDAFFALLDLMSRREQAEKAAGRSDGFFTYSVAERYLERLNGAGDTARRAQFLTFMHAHFPASLAYEAEKADIEYELGQKRRPPGYWVPGTEHTFGRFPQTGNGENKPIEWIVLEQRGGCVLLISKYGLELMPYCEGKLCGRWAESPVRTWLNEVFLQAAFTPEERFQLETVTAAGGADPASAGTGLPGAEDRVTLLSAAEAKRYFRTNSDRTCLPTPYLAARPPRLFAAVPKRSYHWWLRSDGNEPVHVSYNGKIRTIDIQPNGRVPASFYTFCIRPVILLRL